MNLLTDPLLRVQTDNGLRRMNLPQLLVALGRDEVLHFPGIQRHQEDALHVFLCYLAGAILVRCGHSDPIQEEEYWRDGLRSLAGAAGDDAWTLAVDDPSRPAFMQPPLPAVDHPALKHVSDAPDDLDLLLTAKNHDVKQARALNTETDTWVYTLISLQTMSGYYGPGHQGISRMNSGRGTRSVVELTRTMRSGGRWRDAVERLLSHREEVLAEPFGYDPQGLVLVWVEPWDGTTSLRLSRLDPFYVEICRRIRLQREGETKISAYFLPSLNTRIAAKELNGIVGDPWLPITLETGKALVVSDRGWDANLLRRLIFEGEGMKLSALQRPPNDWKGDLWLSVSVLVRGQGTTDGFHERRILLPAKVRAYVFGVPERRDPFAALSKTAIEYAGKMRYGVLKPAVMAHLNATTETTSQDRKAMQAWCKLLTARFEDLWSDAFFSWLWSVPEPFNEDDALAEWVIKLRDFALDVLREAVDLLPKHEGRRYRARVMAEQKFWMTLYAKNNFPFLKEERHERVTST